MHVIAHPSWCDVGECSATGPGTSGWHLSCVVLRGEHAQGLGHMLLSAGLVADNRAIYDRSPP
jgi:hypothetical protein